MPPPLLRTPLRKNYWVEGDAVRHGKSCDLALLNAAKTVFLAATVPVLLSDIITTMAYFAKVASPHISESTERAKFRMAPIDSSLKVAYCKVSSAFS